MEKILALTVVMLTVVLLLVGCGSIEDTNGQNDKSLVTITEEKLKSVSGHISIGNSRKSGSPSIHRYKDAGGFSDEKYDYDFIEFDFTRLNGTCKTMITYLDKGQLLKLDFSSVIDLGNFRAVVLSPDRSEILASFSADEKKIVSVTAEEKGDYLLLIAGESCSGSISVSRSYN